MGPWRNRWQMHCVLLTLCLIPSIVLGFQGLARPYDAVPDQDLLWASEALRLIRGVAPSYADHPGAFWSLTYEMNINILQLIGNRSVLDSSSNITPYGIELAIKTARLQNAIAAGLCAYLLYPASWTVGIQERLASIIAVTCSASSALLVGVSEIRHEIISIVFLLLSLTTFSAAIYQDKSLFRRGLTLASVGLFFCAGFSKNQSLLLSPLLFLAMGAATSQRIKTDGELLIGSDIRNSRNLAVFAFASCVPWLISSAPDIDAINLPAWLIINSALSFIVSIGWFKQLNLRLAYRALFGLGIFEILLFKLLAPQWWRMSVTGFPSWMFRYANHLENPYLNPGGQILLGIRLFFSNLFTPAGFSKIAFIASIFTATWFLIRHIITQQTGTDSFVILPTCWLLCGIVLIVSSQRIPSTPRYDLFSFIPLLLTAAATWSKKQENPTNRRSKHPHMALLSIGSMILLTSASIKSISNLNHLRTFINPGQSEGTLCIGHHMDQSMRLTSVGKCKIFEKGARDKGIYDSWWGPNR